MDADLKIRDDVLAELKFEPQVDAAAIGVAVRDGVATLSGRVSCLTQRFAAESAARRVKGVRAVALNIDVQLSDERPSDELIAARAADVLSWNALPYPSPIHVRVEDGCVRLTGHVEWAYQRDGAERAVRPLAGVRDVVNDLRVKARVLPTEVEKHIAQAFHRDADLERRHLTVSVDGSTVTLSGHVKTWHEQDMANRAAWSTPGVTSVIDKIEIG
jgi:osmotically-inducible protein OsmY